jgi:SM-20-related protein
MQDYIQYYDFLPSQQNNQLLQQTILMEKDFVTAGVINYSDDYPDWRRAKVSFNSDNLKLSILAFKEKVFHCYSEVCRALKMDKLSIFDIDIQITCHNDVDYFKPHRDNGTTETNNRVLTFVYYFNKYPKEFSGGELILHSLEQCHISPDNNMIVFFKPSILHEVKKIHCQSPKFENSRFTLNGWILDSQ